MLYRRAIKGRGWLEERAGAYLPRGDGGGGERGERPPPLKRPAASRRSPVTAVAAICRRRSSKREGGYTPPARALLLRAPPPPSPPPPAADKEAVRRPADAPLKGRAPVTGPQVSRPGRPLRSRGDQPASQPESSPSRPGLRREPAPGRHGRRPSAAGRRIPGRGSMRRSRHSESGMRAKGWPVTVEPPCASLLRRAEIPRKSRGK